MRTSLIAKIVQSARGMIERAFVRKELNKPHHYQLTPNTLKIAPPKINTHFDTQEADAFRMKAISLLRPHGLFDTIQEKISSIQLAPLHRQTNENQITLSQVLHPFPGERIELRGTFLRVDNRTIPVANSFELQRISHVTGFPHPAQNIGWAFSSDFLDDQNQLNQIRQALMPGEPLRQRAKDWAAAKKRVFDLHKDEFCDDLKTLVEAIVGSSEIVDRFFNQAKGRPDCYDFISSTHAASKTHPASEYMLLVNNALKEQKQVFKECAKFEFNQYLASLKREPGSPEELYSHFKTSINSEIEILTKN